jgi:hypothetical protein
VLRADQDEREALLSVGRPFFASRAGRERIGVLLTDDTWRVADGARTPPATLDHTTS